MASHSGGFQPLCYNQEMESDQGQPKILCDFLKSAELPTCVCVCGGNHITSSVQITKGDVLFLKSCEAKAVTLTHQDTNTGTRKQVNVPLDFPYKFNVLPPKTVSDRTASMILYPSVADLVMDSPTYFEATSSYDDPYLPGFSIHRGDRFKFKGLVMDPKDGRERLKVTDELDNVILLSLVCRANFYPLEDEESYTLRQLIDFAPVPRRLRLSKRDSAVSISSSEDSGFKDGISVIESEKDNNSCFARATEKVDSCEKDVSQLINCDGVIHMLKPYLTVKSSPLNDSDTLWKIPITADLYVREHDLDDYEVPSVAKSQMALVPTPSPTPLTPTFSAPPTPPLPQPLVPVNSFNFIDIYGCPVKAKIMDMSQCDSFLQTLFSVSEDISVYRIEKSKRLYAEDLKTGNVYSFAKNVKLSFIEYPQKFSEVSELLKLPLGSEVTVLEDIATDFPRPFSLQFGDILRITTNTAALIKAKHTNIECKIMKCERVNRGGGSNTKLKLPLDFEVQMVLSVDPNSRRVIFMDDLISGSEAIPSQEVATLIDNSEKSLQDLPINLKLLKILPEKLMVASRISTSKSETVQPGDWPSPTHHCSPHRNVGISLTSGLLLAFRERMDMYEFDPVQSVAEVIQIPVEILTASQFEEREQMCKVWIEDEDETEVQSVASDDRSSTLDVSSQGSANPPTRQSEKNRRQKKAKDRIRRLSQVLNPKHWRPPKAAPEPLPHPEAIGLMALAMRPPSDQFNDYQIKEPHNSNSSVSSDENEDIYEDVEIGPLRISTNTPPPTKGETKRFFGPLHKSLPLKQIMSRSHAKTKAKKIEKAKLPVSSPILEGSTDSLDRLESTNDAGQDPDYDSPELCDDAEQKHKLPSRIGKGYDVPRNNILKRLPTAAMPPRQNFSLPPLPPPRSTSTVEKESSISISKHKSLDSLLDQSKSSPSPKTMNNSSEPKEMLTNVKNLEEQNKSLTFNPSSTSAKQKEAVEEEQANQSKSSALKATVNINSVAVASKEKDTFTIIKQEKTSVEPPVPPQRKKRIKSVNESAIAGSGTSTPSSDSPRNSPKPETKSKRLENPPGILKAQEKNSPLNSTFDSDDTEKEDSGSFSKADLASKKVYPHKMPVPKPRGLKKGKPSELSLSRSDSNPIDSESEIVKDKTQRESVNGKEGRQEGKVPSRIEPESRSGSKGEHSSHTEEANSDRRTKTDNVKVKEVSVRKSESVKPKPPPKPKPRLSMQTSV